MIWFFCLIFQVEGSSCSQCNVAHLEPSTSSKESEQPSPASVLEAPFVEDLSSGSECFERVSADLHGKNLSLVANDNSHAVFIFGHNSAS